MSKKLSKDDIKQYVDEFLESLERKVDPDYNPENDVAVKIDSESDSDSESSSAEESESDEPVLPPVKSASVNLSCSLNFGDAGQ